MGHHPYYHGNQPLQSLLMDMDHRLVPGNINAGRSRAHLLQQLGKLAKVENTHPHWFRRTIATDLLNREMPIEQVKDFLGHEKQDTTMIYCSIR